MKSHLVVGIFAILLLLNTALVLGQEDLPIGLQKLKEANQKEAEKVVETVSFLIAFLAGVTTVLSPCILPILPAFFTYAFEEKKRITKMTVVFFAGFTPVFILLGVLATTAASLLQALLKSLDVYIAIAGLIMMLLGLFYFFGKGFRLLPIKPKMPEKSAWGVFVFGLLFGLGWIVCTGPILSGVLLAASIFQNYVTASFLMISYALGVFFPIFLIAFFYDSKNLGQSRLMKGWEIPVKAFHAKLWKPLSLSWNNVVMGSVMVILSVSLIHTRGYSVINPFSFFNSLVQLYIVDGSTKVLFTMLAEFTFYATFMVLLVVGIIMIFSEKPIHLHTNHMFAGGLLTFIGILFFFQNGTAAINTFQMFGLKNYFYEFQYWILDNILVANIIGALFFLPIVVGIWYFVIRKKK